MNTSKPLYHASTALILLSLLLVPQGAAAPARSAQASESVSFVRHVIDETFTRASSAYSADLDNDGDMDVIGGALSSEGLVLWENDGSGGLTRRQKLTSQRVRELYVTDLDRDGDADILYAGDDYLLWSRNDGGWNFTGRTVAAFYGAWAIHAADVDGDGDIDVLSTSHGGGMYDAGRVAWWENDGQENFTRHLLTDRHAGRDHHAVFGADMDRYGDMDILCAVGYHENLVYWFENGGNGTFVARHTIAKARPESIYATDLDADGDMDVVSSGAWYENDGTQTFTSHATGSGRAVYPVDLDGDGDVDIVTESAWHENNGDGSFTQHRHGADWLNPNAHVAHAADLDRDGDLDMVAPDYTDESDLVWWENTASEGWPDLALESIDWSPSEPETMETASIHLQLRNVGLPYVADKGTLLIELTLRDTTSGDEYLWVFPETIASLGNNETADLDIDPFLFSTSDVDQIQVCLKFDDPEHDLSNNCRTESITVTAPAEPWRACMGMLLGVVDAVLESMPAGQVWEGTKQISRIFATQVPNMIVACTDVDAECMRAVVFFLVDSGITLARLLSEASVLKVLAVGRAVVQQFWDSFECGEYLFSVLRMWVENASHRNVDVNAVAVLSPAYVRVVDSSGRRAGFLDDGAPVGEIPNAEAFALDSAKFVLYSGEDTASIELTGTGTGTFDLIVSLSQPASEVHTATYLDVPITPATKGTIDAAGGNYTLALDDDGDGIPDRNIEPTEVFRADFARVHLPATMRGN